MRNYNKVSFRSQNRKHRYELVENNELRKQCNIIFIDEKSNQQKVLAVKVIMDCRTASAHKFRTRLSFKRYYVILTKKQSVLT